MNKVKQSVDAAIDYLSQHPSEARYRDNAAIATIEDTLRVKIADDEGRHVLTDMPAGVGGGAAAVSPGWLLRAALASCVATLIAIKAAQEEIELSSLEVIVDSESDDRGILGIDSSVPAGPLSVNIRVHIQADAAVEGTLRDLVNWAVEHCPVADAVQRAVPMTTDIHIR